MRLRLLPAETRFDFMGMRRLAVGASVAAALLSLVALLALGLNLGIDFRGGTVVMAETAGTPDVGAIRSALGGLGLPDYSVTGIGDPAAALTGAARDAVMIRVASDGEAGAQSALVARLQGALDAASPGIRFLSVDSVGGKVSGELVWAGVLALFAAVAAMLVYIWLRFEWQFAAAAVLALVHDVVLTLGLFAVVRLEFNLSIVAALLTIIGYSINDTVVVFDRVREELRRYKTMPLAEVLNLAVNATLSRTLMTSGTTLAALLALYILGGEVIRGFTFGMIWGIAVGTYSSIFVAAALILWLGVDREPAPDPAGVRFGVKEG